MYTQRSKILNHPATAVFSFLGNPENWPLIEAGLLEYTHLSGPPNSLGAVYLSRKEQGGRIAETHMRVTEYLPNYKIVVEGDWENLVKPGGGFLVESVAAGTQITAFVKVGTRGIARLIVPCMLPVFRRSLDSILSNLNRVMDQRVAHV